MHRHNAKREKHPVVGNHTTGGGGEKGEWRNKSKYLIGARKTENKERGRNLYFSSTKKRLFYFAVKIVITILFRNTTL
jgi:hypothetical protein